MTAADNELDTRGRTPRDRYIHKTAAVMAHGLDRSRTHSPTAL